MKWKRTYTLTVEGTNDTHVIEYPLTLTFNISRNVLASANTAHITIYNLREAVRRDIFQDRFDLPSIANLRTIQLEAGYENEPSLPTIFRGDIRWAYSYRVGVNWLTEIEAFDNGGAILNGQYSTTRGAGWNVRDVLKDIIGSMPGTSVGAISDFTSQNSRGLTLVGNSWDLVNRVVKIDGSAFIDNGSAHVLKPNDYIDGYNAEFPLITSETGMKGTPRRYNSVLEVPVIFEPRAKVGQIVEINSLAREYNGIYKVNGVKHDGMISGAEAGDAETTLSLFLGTSRLVAVQSQTPTAVPQ